MDVSQQTSIGSKECAMPPRYTSLTRLAKRISTLRMASLTGSDTTIQEWAIERGEGEVDTILAGSAAPAFADMTLVGQQLLADFSDDCAIYYLADRLGTVTDRVDSIHVNAVLRLKDMRSSGRAFAATGTVQQAPTIRMGSADRIFKGIRGTDPGTLGGF